MSRELVERLGRSSWSSDSPLEIVGVGAMRDCFDEVTGGTYVGLDDRKPLRRAEDSWGGFDIGLGAGAGCGSRAGGSATRRSGGSRCRPGPDTVHRRSAIRAAEARS